MASAKFRVMYVLLLYLQFIIIDISGERVRYDGYEVLRLDIHSEQHIEALKTVQDSGKYDFWHYPNHVMTSPTHKQELVRSLELNDIDYDIWIEDVQQLIDNYSPDTRTTTTAQDDYDYSVYHTYAEIDQWVKDTAARYPTLAKEFVIGSSYENRVMRALKVGSESSEVKPAMWVHSGIHAREWVTPATNTWMTNQLLVDYSTNDLVRTLLDTFDFYILPITNPDGYEYTWTDDRMWRKTRSVNDDSTCIGVDPNRNWAYEWGGSGASKFPCFDTYRGPYPHSEVEVRNVADFILERAKTQEFVFFMDIHSYSQMWLNPWGYTEEYPEDYDDHMKVGEIFTEAVASVHGQQYTYGTIPDLLYVSSGCSVDWGHGIMGIKYSHTTELRDTGEYAFLLPEDQIIPTAQETYAGFVAAYEHIMNERVSS
ncbi:carboxypeptidase B-like [Saccoglossus kowalevskii]|uniref:Carboxypeptidase A2-like n=1 Tax=Saccoglossus kowalevskii TaxID=10224 RepID=A0ABM0GZZ8_SACKO|nr:PREDICTED: carboxypeptidase A2-like [Saccoglossus kowalevskii]